MFTFSFFHLIARRRKFFIFGFQIGFLTPFWPFFFHTLAYFGLSVYAALNKLYFETRSCVCVYCNVHFRNVTVVDSRGKCKVFYAAKLQLLFCSELQINMQRASLQLLLNFLLLLKQNYFYCKVIVRKTTVEFEHFR